MFWETCCKAIALVYKYIGWVLLTAFLITACHSGSPQNTSLEKGRSLSADCRVVEHAVGKTKICGKPQKIAVLEPKMLSLVLALDVQPAAYADAYLVRSPQFDNPSQQIPYLGNFVTSQPINLGDRSSPSLEKLTLLKPDLILGLNYQDNQLFSAIAPTVLIDSEQNWQDNIKIVAKALDSQKNISSIITSQQQKIAQVRTQLAPLVNTHPRVLNLACSLSMDYIEVISQGKTNELLKKIGFQPVFLPDLVQKLGLRPQINLETLGQIDADIIIINTWIDNWNGKSAYTVPFQQLKQKWAASPILHNSRAWKEGRVYFVDYTLWSDVIGAPIASYLILEQLPSLLLLPT
ncbi:iron-siderophore ABC transporter substrate-binding protein [Nostoc sp. FACHB-152]|uniref:iron-siderophore ABC transporter substrate-binding protein n=1 Tax=unclassified Nostoc TaxID=2593658 RepID=UPI0016857CF2|nr:MULTISPECIES: iron-siderophore ABC transporter substrate-binding protein [unclassified Nostoc]MBD2448909.1 iron-siderophore ABC transporter substrate-binding protein [Nostoc sp. FACHB-152]MBD2471163.1 iron-siderophore ABC transporter substrate-binding protein [Nostoc sp. FACHB-145]